MANALDITRGSLLENNLKRQIDNPLRHCKPGTGELESLAREFAHLVDEVSLDQVVSPNENTFITAARIAFDPPNWADACNAEEKRVWQVGKSSSDWNQPRALRAAVLALALSAATHGFCQSVLNGSNQTLPKHFNFLNEEGLWTSRGLWIYGGLNGIVYLTAGLCGCFLSDPLQSTYFGRRFAILLAASLCFASAIGGACSETWEELMIWRAVLGVGLGAKASVTPLFCAEIFNALGIFLGFTVSLALARTGSLSWRLQTASACVPAAFLIVLVWNIPESPRWLLKKGRYREAFASMCDLRKSRLEAATEVLYANAQIQAEVHQLPTASRTSSLVQDLSTPNKTFQESVKSTNYGIRIAQLFRHPGNRRATVAAAVVMLGQQLCGINILAFYSTTFFRDIGHPHPASPDEKALWLSWGFGLANFVFALPAYFWIDSRGRRFLLLSTYPGLILCMFGATLSSLVAEHKVRDGLICAFVFLFVLFYSFGQGPVAFTYASEVFPLLTREVGMSFSVFVNLTGAGILSLFVPQSTPTGQSHDRDWRKLQTRLLGVFTLLSVLSFILIFLLVPETAKARVSKHEGKLHYLSLEELRYIFGVRTRQNIHDQFRVVLPNLWKSLKSRVRGIFYKQEHGDEKQGEISAPQNLSFAEFDFDYPPMDLPIEKSDEKEAGEVVERLAEEKETAQLTQLQHERSSCSGDHGIQAIMSEETVASEEVREQGERDVESGLGLDERLAGLLEEVIPLLQQRQRRHS